MSSRWPRTLVLVVMATIAGGLFAADKKDAKNPQMDEKAMMEAWMKAATPGDQHKKLQPVIGTWDVQVKSWMAPGAPPEESTGTSESTWALGGRYVQQTFHGSMMGQPFEGIGYIGYDNIRKQYVSTWMDNMSTAVMSSTGSLDPSGKGMTFKGTMDDPMSGKPMKTEEKMSIGDNDHHMLEMWSPGPDGKMFKSMEITYTRKQ